MRHNLVSGWKHTEATLEKMRGRRGPLCPSFGKPSPHRKFRLSKEELEQKIRNGQTTISIAKEAGVDRTILQKWMRRYGIRLTDKEWSERLPRGNDHHNFNGYKRYARGYVLLSAPDHPFVNPTGYVWEHRLVIEKFIGRYLLPAEVVHHINLKKADNRLENLILFHTNSEHICFHAWVERHGAYALGLVEEPPADLEYADPILVGGQWVTRLGLI